MHKAIGWFFSVVFGIGVLVLSLSWWTDTERRPPSYDFTESEMRAAVEGTWKLELVRKLDGKPEERHTLTFAVVQATRKLEPIETHSRRASLIRRAEACGNRTLVRTAGACFDSTTMPLQIVLYELPLPVRGQLHIADNFWHHGSFDVMIGNIKIRAEMTKKHGMGFVRANEGYIATLTRIARR